MLMGFVPFSVLFVSISFTPQNRGGLDTQKHLTATIQSHWRQGNCAQAVAMAEYAFTWFPDHPATWKSLVMILLAQGKWPNAQLALQQALSLSPADKALQLWAQGLLFLVREPVPQHALALRGLADAMLIEASPEDAENVAWIAMRQGIREPWVDVCRAQALWRQKLRDAAMAVLHDAIAHRPAAEFWLALAQFEIERHEFSHAIEILRTGLTQFPDDATLAVLMCSTCLNAGDLMAAKASIERLLDVQPDHPEALTQRGVVSMRLGYYRDAITHFREAMSVMLAQGKAPPARPCDMTGFDSEHNQALMWSTLAQLSNKGVHAFPMAGTLLGLIRDGRLLPFDKDLDFGVPWAEMALAVECLQANGWVEHCGSYGLNNPRAFRHLASGMVLDLCGLETAPGGDQMLGGFWMGRSPGTDDRVTVFPRIDLVLEQRAAGSVWMPVNAEAVLTALYGDWRTPDPDFDTVIGAKNLRDFSPLTHCYALLRILGRWQQGHLAKARALLLHTLKYVPDDVLLGRVQAHLQVSHMKSLP